MGSDCQPPCCGRRFDRTFRYKVHSCHSGRGMKRLLLCQTRCDGNANLPTACCSVTLRHWAVVSRCFEGTRCRNIQMSGGATAVKESHSFVTSTVDETDERPASRFGRIVPRYALYRKAGCSVGLDAVSTFRRSVAGRISGALVRSQASPCGICGGHSGTGTGFPLSVPFHLSPTLHALCHNTQ